MLARKTRNARHLVMLSCYHAIDHDFVTDAPALASCDTVDAYAYNSKRSQLLR